MFLVVSLAGMCECERELWLHSQSYPDTSPLSPVICNVLSLICMGFYISTIGGIQTLSFWHSHKASLAFCCRFFLLFQACRYWRVCVLCVFCRKSGSVHLMQLTRALWAPSLRSKSATACTTFAMGSHPLTPPSSPSLRTESSKTAAADQAAQTCRSVLHTYT